MSDVVGSISVSFGPRGEGDCPSEWHLTHPAVDVWNKNPPRMGSPLILTWEARASLVWSRRCFVRFCGKAFGGLNTKPRQKMNTKKTVWKRYFIVDRAKEIVGIPTLGCEETYCRLECAERKRILFVIRVYVLWAKEPTLLWGLYLSGEAMWRTPSQKGMSKMLEKEKERARST